jgi:hypothetical protein
MRGYCSVFFSILLAMVTISASGERGAAEEAKPADRSAEERNELGLFLGGTHTSDDDGFSVGIDYERRLGRWFGIGGLVEFTGGDFRDGVLAMPFYWHVWKELKLVGAPGVEFAAGDGSDDFLVRLGGEYGFDTGHGFELAPALYVDITDEETALVYGVSFAKSF